jgi:hypothetical protein
MKLRPCSPTPRMNLSMMNAARAMYPVSSRKPMKRKRMAICGRKTTTEPTPAKMPSTIRLCRSPGGRADPTAAPSPPTSPSTRSISGDAQVKMDWKTSAISTRKMIGPPMRWRTTASIRSVSVFPEEPGRWTVRSITPAIQP